ncbi:hypothetical protein BRADI_3g20793v3 [Brachypodium distachyon]|uniref:Uncharacterized protein n=1 Tax=Brachypodium distachyon TaxID=15368 RepID=A0A2K2CYJ1_BRADI|nr:hypothetical protein BRADI_3g20793v3 [Brachypodium distachyon]
MNHAEAPSSFYAYPHKSRGNERGCGSVSLEDNRRTARPWIGLLCVYGRRDLLAALDRRDPLASCEFCTKGAPFFG